MPSLGDRGLKRVHPGVPTQFNPPDIIDLTLSDSDEHAAKKQKSVTPGPEFLSTQANGKLPGQKASKHASVPFVSTRNQTQDGQFSTLSNGFGCRDSTVSVGSSKSKHQTPVSTSLGDRPTWSTYESGTTKPTLGKSPSIHPKTTPDIESNQRHHKFKLQDTKPANSNAHGPQPPQLRPVGSEPKRSKNAATARQNSVPLVDNVKAISVSHHSSAGSSLGHASLVKSKVLEVDKGKSPSNHHLHRGYRSSPQPVINIPLSAAKKKAQKIAETNRVINQLKLSPTYIVEHLAEVQSIIGDTGFTLPKYSTEDNTVTSRLRSQKKVREVDRSKTRLELNTDKSISRHIHRPNQAYLPLHPQEQVNQILTDRFTKSTTPALTFTNDFNDRKLNGKFQFVSEYVLSRGVKAKKKRVIPKAARSKRSCQCFIEMRGDDSPSESQAIQFYHRHREGLLVLTDEYLDDLSNSMEITECTNECHCSPNCDNRVVQRGRTVPLNIFETGKYGFGVRALQNLYRGQFIEVYWGELITELELKRREFAAEEDTPSYIFSLDWNNNKDYHVDGQKIGSAMRFVNHSCNPNARTIPVMNPNGSKHHLLAFFAVRDIKAGTEITIDYHPGQELDVNQEAIDDETVVKCLCEERNCRKRLWKETKSRSSGKRYLRNFVDD